MVTYFLKRGSIVFMTLIILVFMLSFSVIQAQSEVTISIAIPSYSEDTYEDVILEFEEENPGVRVHIETTEYGIPFYYSEDISSYLDDVASYAETADVLLITDELMPEATRAGYLLDMSPLVNTDTTLDVNDFYPSLWDAFQWDDGVWGMPIAGDVIGLFYDPVAFDEADLAYPNENWSVEDFAFAAETLAEFDASGELVVPGFLSVGSQVGLGMLLISMLGDDVVDDSIIPNVPDFSNPEIASLMADWVAIKNLDVMEYPQGGFSLDEFPLLIGPTWIGTNFGDGYGGVPAPFPGGGIGVVAQGFAISAGTQNPELSYELIKFLTSSPIVTETFFSETSARRSLAEIDSSGLGMFTQRGLEEGISFSEARFSHYLVEIINRPSGRGLVLDNQIINAQEALEGLDEAWMRRLSIADERGQTTDFAVIQPPSTPVLADGETSLHFHLNMNFSPLPNENEWQTFFDTFAANEPEIGFVDWEGGYSDNYEQIAEDYDCFYSPYNIVQAVDPTLLIRLDPLMFADPNLDMNDFLPNILPIDSGGNAIWGFPIMLQPLVMSYEVDFFVQAGVSFPENIWTVDEFELVLRDLASYLGDAYPFLSPAHDNAYLLNLIAAYGGVPVDMRTVPVTYNFTNPVNVEAIRQVLNLIADGYINYNELANPNPSYNFLHAPIFTEFLNGSNFGFDDSQFDYRFVTFPRGSQYSAITIEVGSGYISAHTSYIDACYRLISQMSSRPDLFYAMPARQSMIEVPELVATQSQEAVDFYYDLSELMQQQDMLILNGANTANRYFELYWLNRVFDQYVAGEIDDLALALAEAEGYTLAFQECAADIAPYQEGIDDPETYFNQYGECATSIDPTSAEFFGF